jgi:hypothetical protein
MKNKVNKKKKKKKKKTLNSIVYLQLSVKLFTVLVAGVV